jgi:hypothetical protein
MRRKLRNVPNGKNKAFVYVCAVIALGIYGIPKIPSLHPGIGGTFSMIWILFGVLALAANTYFLVGADKERSRMLETHAIKSQGPREPSNERSDTDRRRAY